jgi:hypothetical protein
MRYMLEDTYRDAFVPSGELPLVQFGARSLDFAIDLSEGIMSVNGK